MAKYVEEDLDAQFAKPAAKDSNGAELNEGDTVVVIKDLPVKGAGSSTIKRGTTFKGIRLTNHPEEVECREKKIGTVVLKTCFLKKA